jgi:hypothetical protein
MVVKWIASVTGRSPKRRTAIDTRSKPLQIKCTGRRPKRRTAVDTIGRHSRCGRTGIQRAPPVAQKMEPRVILGETLDHFDSHTPWQLLYARPTIHDLGITRKICQLYDGHINPVSPRNWISCRSLRGVYVRWWRCSVVSQSYSSAQ